MDRIKVTNIIFDYGNVISEAQLQSDVEAMAEIYGVTPLSNMPNPIGQYLLTDCDWFPTFDNIVFSSDVKMVKPDREIYEHCLRTSNAQAHETLFLDDRSENVLAAQEVGIHGILFTDFDTTLSLIEAKFDLVPSESVSAHFAS